MANEDPPGTSGDGQPGDAPGAGDEGERADDRARRGIKVNSGLGGIPRRPPVSGGTPPDDGGGTAAAPTHHTRGSGGWEPLTCLVVEDDASVRELCEQTLAAEGHHVLSAPSGEEALELVSATAGGNGGGRVDLLVTDVVLPGMDGTQLADEVAAHFPEAGVLLMSGHDLADLGLRPGRRQEDPTIWWRRGRSRQRVEARLLAKPFTPEQLVAAARACGEGKPFTKAGDGRTIAADRETDAPRREGPRLVGFGTFTVSRRVAAIAAAAGIAVLASVALVLAGSGGEVELAGDGASDVEIEEAAVSDRERDAGEGDDPGDPQDGDGNQRAGGVSGDDNEQTQDQSGSDNSHTATAEGEGNEQAQDQPGDAGTSPGGTAASEPTAGYEAPTVGAPQLASCTSSRDDGTTEYVVASTITTTGGAYDVLSDEPFIGNDRRLEVRGGDLTWTIEAIHVRGAGDEADPFHVAAPDVLGWAEPGGDVRQHSHQPPPLEVYVDQCRG